jgi:hypothetical protein
MSDLSRQGQIAPQDPSNYAPRRLHKKPEQRSTLPSEPRAEPEPKPEPAWLAAARAHSLDPEVMPEPPGLERGAEWWSMAGFVSRLALAVGVAAVAAWFFVIMAAPRPNAGSSLASTLESSAASRTRQVEDGSKLAEFRGLLATSAEANQSTAPRQSDQLLQQFLVWREKTTPNNPPQ